MKERIRELRKSLKLTQQEFAERIGSTQNILANYEIGRRNPSSSVINNICKTFNVREEWLRDGEGEMFIASKETVLMQLSSEYKTDALEMEMLEAYLQLSPKVREAIKRYVKELFRRVISNKETYEEIFGASESKAATELAINEKVEAYRQKLLNEAGIEITPQRPMGTYEGISEAAALYEKSLGIAPNTELSASTTIETNTAKNSGA